MQATGGHKLSCFELFPNMAKSRTNWPNEIHLLYSSDSLGLCPTQLSNFWRLIHSWAANPTQPYQQETLLAAINRPWLMDL